MTVTTLHTVLAYPLSARIYVSAVTVCKGSISLETMEVLC